MARRRYSHRRSSSGMRGLGDINLKGIFVGAGAAALSDGIVPNVIPYQDVAEGAVIGKIVKTGALSGAIGGLVKIFLKGGTSTSSSIYNY